MASRRLIRSFKGEALGRISGDSENCDVFDPAGRFLGRCRKGRLYDRRGLSPGKGLGADFLLGMAKAVRDGEKLRSKPSRECQNASMLSAIPTAISAGLVLSIIGIASFAGVIVFLTRMFR